MHFNSFAEMYASTKKKPREPKEYIEKKPKKKKEKKDEVLQTD